MTFDHAAAYATTRERLCALLVGGAMMDASDRPVAATPGWSIHDVLAHLVGITEDAVSGNLAGAPGDAWTAAQVERGRRRSITELVGLWYRVAPQFEASLSAGSPLAPMAVLDIATHEADLRLAMGLPFEVPRPVLGWAAGWLSDGFAERVGAAGLEPVTVEASPAEWFRGRCGRRTADEVCSLGWSAPPAAYLPLFSLFPYPTVSLGESTDVAPVGGDG